MLTKFLGLHFEINDLKGCLEYLDPGDFLLDRIIKSTSEFKDEVYRRIGPDAYFGIWEERFIEEEKVLKKMYKKINPLDQQRIQLYIFDGSYESEENIKQIS